MTDDEVYDMLAALEIDMGPRVHEPIAPKLAELQRRLVQLDRLRTTAAGAGVPLSIGERLAREVDSFNRDLRVYMLWQTPKGEHS